MPKGLTVLQWVADFGDRIKQLQKISHAANTGGAKGLKVCYLVLCLFFVLFCFACAGLFFFFAGISSHALQLACNVYPET